MWGGIYDLPLGRFGIKDNGSGIVALDLEPDSLESEYGHLKESALSLQAVQELEEYLLGQRMVFNVPLDPQGSVFAKTVWRTLLQIPYGEVRSYKQIAQIIGKPKASRAIGLASHQNPILIMIPCHRVIGSNGKMIGFAKGLSVKMQLLNIEGFIKNHKDCIVKK